MLAITVVTGSPAVAAAEGDLASTVVVVVSTTATHRLVAKQACDAPVSPQPLFKATKPGSVDLESLNGGLGGSYTVFDVADGARAGVFKPVAEEYVDDQGRPSGKRGLVVGGGAVRERAAYLLDPEVVPATELVVLEGQRGSLQAWVDNAGSADDFGTGLFDVDNVQRVAALDLRLANCDRHGGNLLVSEPADAGSSYRLTPIDHGCVLPESLEDLFFAWQYWRQVRQPVTPAVKAYVNAIDIEADLAVLSSIGISPASCAVYRATTSLLKAGVAAGLTLFDIAQLVTRPRLSEPSDLELALAGHDDDDSDHGDASTDDDAEEVDACGNGWTRTMTAHQVEQAVRDLVDAGLQ